LTVAKRRREFVWRTSEDFPEDFTARQGDISIARVHRLVSVSNRGWSWACNAHLECSAEKAGSTKTKEKACHAVLSDVGFAPGSRRQGRGVGAGKIRLVKHRDRAAYAEAQGSN